MSHSPNSTASPSGTVTFLFTDIEGSTRLWEERPEAMRSCVARHDALTRSILEAHDGFIFKALGDAFCAAFPTAPSALDAALELQRALCAEAWATGTALCVRMALHTGAAELRDNDYFGQPLSRVARILSAGHGGQVLLSLATEQLTRDTLPPNAALKHCGEHYLRDLSRPETVYQLLHPDLRADFPPLKSLDNPDLPNNLPQQVTSFIGREKELAEVKSLLTRTRLLTLTGAGGGGKTRLALQAAADVLDQYPDGVWFAELASLSDPALVAQAVAQAVCVKERAGQEVIQTLTEHLKSRKALLVLDNCEHLLTSCAELGPALLRACPHLKVLATSREALGFAGEQTFRVPSLSLPEPGWPPTRQNVSQYESVRLFVERAKLVKFDFAVSDRNAPALAQICCHLDGIPLAIELAAARVRVLSVEDIDKRLDNRFRLLTGGSTAALPRHQTLRALIDWSYNLLGAQERRLLHRLCVFVGGWTLEAVEEVCADPDLEDNPAIVAEEAIDLLSGLVDKSLVVMEERENGTRYRLLETIRQYCLEHPDNKAEAALVLPRRLGYFAQFVKENAERLRNAEAHTAVQRLEEEHNNILAVVDWCHEAGQPNSGLEIGLNLCHFWAWRGYRTEGTYRLRSLMTHTQALQDLKDAIFNRMVSLGYFPLQDTAADQELEQILKRKEASGDTQAISDTLGNLGHRARDRGDAQEARHYLEWCLRLHQTLNNPNDRAWAYMMLSRVMQSQEDFQNAEATLRQALQLFSDIPNYEGIGWAHYLLAGMLQRRPTDSFSVSEILQVFEASFVAFQAQGSAVGMLYSRLEAGKAARQRGSLSDARQRYEECLSMLEKKEFKELKNVISEVQKELETLNDMEQR